MNLKGTNTGCRITCGMTRSCGRADSTSLQNQSFLSFMVLKTPSERSRDGCIIKDTVVMLSERPNVRVHNDPLRMCPARESRLWRDAIRRGQLFFGSFLCAVQRNERKLFSLGVQRGRAEYLHCKKACCLFYDFYPDINYSGLYTI